LRHLIEAGYSIGAVITKPDTKSGRGQKLTPPAVKTLAEQHNIPVWQPTKIQDIVNDINSFDQPVGVLSSFGRIIPQNIIDLFTPGIINVHPSLLPAYRGPSPIETTILNGDEHTGVSIMLLSAAMDAGPIYAQATYPLTGTETQPELYEHLADFGSSLLIQHLPHILSGELQPTPQPDAATYTHLLKKNDAVVDPLTYKAATLARKVRAHLVYPKTKLTLLGQPVTITAASASPIRTSALDVVCGDGEFLVVAELIGPSGRRMTGHDFLNGYAA
jgi:methionyl-tRNA formyltransferase